MQAPPGYHVVKEHIAKNPTRGGRRRPTKGSATTAGVAGLAAVGVLALIVANLGGHSHTGAKPRAAAASLPAPAPADGDGNPSAAAPGTPPAAAAAAKAPAPGAASGVAGYSRQYELRVRKAPALDSGQVASYPYNTTLTVSCYTTGPVVYGISGSDDYWVRVTGPDGATGYTADGWIMTTADITALVPAC